MGENKWSYPQLTRLSDEDLICKMAAGCHDALAVLFDRYYRLVLRIASNVLRDSAEAEDLLQTVFLEIYQVARLFDRSKGGAKGWILRYAYHRSLNRQTYLRRRGFYDRRESGVLERSVEEGSVVLAGDTKAWNILELRRFLEEGFDCITAAQRRTLYLSFFEGLSSEEIAERLGEKISNIRHHYYRGLKQLRLFIEGRICSTQTGKRFKGKSSYVKP